MSSWVNPQLANAAASMRAEEARSKSNRNSRTNGTANGISALSSSSPTQRPGRIDDPLVSLATEPRLDPRLRKELMAFGAGGNILRPTMLSLGNEPSIEEIGKCIAEINTGSSMALEMMAENTAISGAEKGVEMEERVIDGGDGQAMLVHILRPTEHQQQQQKDLPAVVYIHGGGMVMFSITNELLQLWARAVAAAGSVVVMVEFRNAHDKNGHHPFPAGLNDCAAAARWVYANKDQLQVSHVVLHGESGGTNLALATALKAKREGWIDEIAGVYGIAPYISNAYGWTREEQLAQYPSLVECEGYTISMAQQAYFAHCYAPNDDDQENPLAWPLYATLDDLSGLPPHVLVMDELDPLRDEGVAYGQKLMAAGVDVESKMSSGGVHDTSVIWRGALLEKSQATVRDIIAFARSLSD